MRSVVVVLPASMWAMMPIFLQRSNGSCRATISFRFSKLQRFPPERLPQPLMICRPRTAAFAFLPAVVGKGLVGLGHAVYVFFLLDSGPTAVGGVQQLVSQLVDHALLAASTAVSQNPADRQRSAAIGVDLHRNLVVGAAYAAGLHFQYRLGVLDSFLEQLDRLVATLFFELLHGGIEDGLGGAFLAVPHHGVNEFVDQRGLVDRVSQRFTLRDMSFSWHRSSRPSASWPRTWNGFACD